MIQLVHNLKNLYPLVCPLIHRRQQHSYQLLSQGDLLHGVPKTIIELNSLLYTIMDKWESVTGSVIQATGMLEFEDGLRIGNHLKARNGLQRVRTIPGVQPGGNAHTQVPPGAD